ncbi:MAG TPA: hypothetical protein PKH77_06265 [Anaerolineae bacterium]|nr:hypothetical protein [Anaerolineae bacterium]
MLTAVGHFVQENNIFFGDLYQNEKQDNIMKISTNFFEMIPSKDQITIPYLSFRDRERLEALKDNNPEAIFMRSRDKILFWGTNSLSSEGVLEITRNENCYLFLNVLSHSLLEQFYQSTVIRPSKKYHVYKIIFFDQDISNNKYRGVKLYRAFHLHFTPFYTNSSMAIGFTISSSIIARISWKVQHFESEKVRYDDLRYDKESGEVFATTETVYRLANHFNYASQIKHELDLQNSIQREYTEVNNFVDRYFRNNLDGFILPDALQINTINGTVYSLDGQRGTVTISTLPKPECYFYNGAYPRRENTFSKRAKISYNKPFTYDEFENRTINVSVIYPKIFYQDVANFFGSVQTELIETFKLKRENLRYSKFEIDGLALRDYQKILSSVRDADLVIVVVDQSHKGLAPHESPYYFCKAEFIKRGINTQEVQIQQIRQFLSDKKSSRPNYTDHNIALNIYAKFGGMAWTIKPVRQKNELVIGIGATTDRDGQPVLGLTAIFRGDGKYVLGKASSVTNMTDYRDKLEQVISSTIESCIKDGTLDTDKTFYLIFHIFKPAGKDNEIEALDHVINRFSNYSFEYAFVHIGENHNYRFFTYEESAQGPQFILKRGLGQNLRGTLIQINPKRGFLGLRPNSAAFYKIDIHEKSSFFDLEYIAEQVYQFAEISHTSYNIQGTPITIKYPHLMAGFVEKFNEGNLIYLDEVTMPDHSLWFV